MNDNFRVALRIAAAHPALAGHFPGNPVVPGVVVLERVAAAFRAWRGVRVEKFDAKFMQPLLPDEDAVIELHGDASRVRFAVTRADGSKLARGTLETAPCILPPLGPVNAMPRGRAVGRLLVGQGRVRKMYVDT